MGRAENFWRPPRRSVYNDYVNMNFPDTLTSNINPRIYFNHLMGEGTNGILNAIKIGSSSNNEGSII